MGSQQLLMIVVGVIIVGLAIFSGLNMISTYYEENNRNQIISHLYTLGIEAQQHSKKTVEQGGGGGKFDGFNPSSKLLNLPGAEFEVRVRPERVDFSGTGTETGRNGSTAVRVTARVDNNGIKISIVN